EGLDSEPITIYRKCIVTYRDRSEVPPCIVRHQATLLVLSHPGTMFTEPSSGWDAAERVGGRAPVTEVSEARPAGTRRRLGGAGLQAFRGRFSFAPRRRATGRSAATFVRPS